MKFLFNSHKQAAKVSASTMLETIVASLIFMIVFTIAMDILTRLFITNHKDNDNLLIESSFSKCNREIKKKGLATSKEIYTFEWGEIQVSISKYKEELFLVEMLAVTHEKKKVNYRYILADEIVGE